MSLINQHGRGSQRLEIPRKGYYILPSRVGYCTTRLVYTECTVHTDVQWPFTVRNGARAARKQTELSKNTEHWCGPPFVLCGLSRVRGVCVFACLRCSRTYTRHNQSPLLIATNSPSFVVFLALK
jgi:hypothetical protein